MELAVCTVTYVGTVVEGNVGTCAESCLQKQSEKVTHTKTPEKLGCAGITFHTCALNSKVVKLTFHFQGPITETTMKYFKTLQLQRSP